MCVAFVLGFYVEKLGIYFPENLVSLNYKGLWVASSTAYIRAKRFTVHAMKSYYRYANS
jgi:hypothetical protein